MTLTTTSRADLRASGRRAPQPGSHPSAAAGRPLLLDDIVEYLTPTGARWAGKVRTIGTDAHGRYVDVQDRVNGMVLVRLTAEEILAVNRPGITPGKVDPPATTTTVTTAGAHPGPDRLP